PPPPLQVPPSASHGRVNVQKKFTHFAPCALHLQLSSVAHQPSCPFGCPPAALQVMVGATSQSHTSPPQAGFAVQSMSLVQACANASRATSALASMVASRNSFIRMERAVMLAPIVGVGLYR